MCNLYLELDNPCMNERFGKNMRENHAKSLCQSPYVSFIITKNEINSKSKQWFILLNFCFSFAADITRYCGHNLTKQTNKHIMKSVGFIKKSLQILTFVHHVPT